MIKFIIILLLLLILYKIISRKKLRIEDFNNNTHYNRLFSHKNKYYLLSSNKSIQNGINPLIFNNYREYINYMDSTPNSYNKSELLNVTEVNFDPSNTNLLKKYIDGDDYDDDYNCDDKTENFNNKKKYDTININRDDIKYIFPNNIEVGKKNRNNKITLNKNDITYISSNEDKLINSNKNNVDNINDEVNRQKIINKGNTDTINNTDEIDMNDADMNNTDMNEIDMNEIDMNDIDMNDIDRNDKEYEPTIDKQYFKNDGSTIDKKYKHTKMNPEVFKKWGFSFMPPDSWSVPQKRPPVCIPQKSCAVCPNMDDKYSDALKWDSVGSIMPKFEYKEIYDPTYYHPGWTAREEVNYQPKFYGDNPPVNKSRRNGFNKYLI